ncbi:ribbon-helix-helix protein, CopG family [Stenotrophomonas maltophilia]|nr:ribbon-helix-helix protein, CopG family [Stenotrophomonas maltophilia]MBA0431310.1 ribbon-helix-helix protein, CopG family [Stenotrophomonas maltophilia]MCF5089211.1 ribbon-helix-helix protein, CopG family [Stenotrophomonas sp. PA-6-5C]
MRTERKVGTACAELAVGGQRGRLHPRHGCLHGSVAGDQTIGALLPPSPRGPTEAEAVTLTSKPPLTAVLPKVSLSSTLRQALAARARAAGVSESEAVRQWLTAYLARPQLLRSPVAGPRDDRLPPIRASRDLADRVRREAQRQHVSVAELIRRVVAFHAF